MSLKLLIKGFIGTVGILSVVTLLTLVYLTNALYGLSDVERVKLLSEHMLFHPISNLYNSYLSVIFVLVLSVDMYETYF